MFGQIALCYPLKVYQRSSHVVTRAHGRAVVETGTHFLGYGGTDGGLQPARGVALAGSTSNLESYATHRLPSSREIHTFKNTL